MRHNFRGNRDTDALIKAGTELTGNKSEFLNYCVLQFGRAAMKEILKAKSKAAENALRDAVRPRKAQQKGGTAGDAGPSRGKPEQE